MPSGYSYNAVIFASKAERDSGARILNENSFIFEGEEIALTVENLTFPRSGTVWHFSASISDTPEAVVEAVENLFGVCRSDVS
jgi:hypothetical protein